LTEDSDFDISDSVVMGDVQQNITTNLNITNNPKDASPHLSCPECGIVGGVVSLIPCSDESCHNKFCNFCHPECRWTTIVRDPYESSGVGSIKANTARFDSGEGLGPFCKHCMNEQMVRWEEKHYYWWQGKKLSETFRYAIGCTVFLVIIALFWGGEGAAIWAIPTAVTWMFYFKNKTQYDTMTLHLEPKEDPLF
jgi:hypothetical protein